MLRAFVRRWHTLRGSILKKIGEHVQAKAVKLRKLKAMQASATQPNMLLWVFGVRCEGGALAKDQSKCSPKNGTVVTNKPFSVQWSALDAIPTVVTSRHDRTPDARPPSPCHSVMLTLDNRPRVFSTHPQDKMRRRQRAEERARDRIKRRQNVTIQVQYIAEETFGSRDFVVRW